MSGHSGYSFSKEDRILKVVEESEIELTPKQIALKADVKHSTTRKYLRKLVKKNKLVQPYRGSYCSKLTHSMIFAPLRCHNVLWTASAPWLQFSDDVVEWTGNVKVRIQFGIQRKKITGRVSCDAGMDRNSVLFALHRAFDIIKERSGHDVENVILKTFEMNRDVHGIRLDGFKCYTKTGLFGMLERIYQKEDNVVRHEHKVSVPMSLDKFEELMRGGVTGYNLQNAIYALTRDQIQTRDAVKFNNEQLIGLTRAVETLVDLLNISRKPSKPERRPNYEI